MYKTTIGTQELGRVRPRLHKCGMFPIAEGFEKVALRACSAKRMRLAEHQAGWVTPSPSEAIPSRNEDTSTDSSLEIWPLPHQPTSQERALCNTRSISNGRPKRSVGEPQSFQSLCQSASICCQPIDTTISLCPPNFRANFFLRFRRAASLRASRGAFLMLSELSKSTRVSSLTAPRDKGGCSGARRCSHSWVSQPAMPPGHQFTNEKGGNPATARLQSTTSRTLSQNGDMLCPCLRGSM